MSWHLPMNPHVYTFVVFGVSKPWKTLGDVLPIQFASNKWGGYSATLVLDYYITPFEKKNFPSKPPLLGSAS